MEGTSSAELFNNNLPVPPENFGLLPLPDVRDLVVTPLREPVIRTFHDADVYRAGPRLHLTSEEIHALKQEYSSRELSSWAHKDMIRSQLARAGVLPMKEERDFVDRPMSEVEHKQAERLKQIAEELKAA